MSVLTSYLRRGVQYAGYDASPYYSATGFSQLHDDGTGGVSISLPSPLTFDC